MRSALNHLIMAALIFALPCLAEAYDVLVVQDQRSPTFDAILEGFRANRQFSERVIALRDFAEIDLVRVVREDHPRLVLAIGGRALGEARRLRQRPVVSVFSYDMRRSAPSSNLVRVGMLPPPARFAALFRALGARRVGTVLSPAAEGYPQEAVEAFRQAGIRLIIREAPNPGEAARQLETLKGAVDAIWLLPDPAVVTGETVEAFARFSLSNRLPLVSFSEAHLRKGAAAAFAVDPADLGRQAAEAAGLIIKGSPPADIGDIPPRKTQLLFNRTVIERLGLSVEPLRRMGAGEANIP